MGLKERFLVVLWAIWSIWASIIAYTAVELQNVHVSQIISEPMFLVMGLGPSVGVVLIQFLICGSILPTSLFRKQ